MDLSNFYVIQENLRTMTREGFVTKNIIDTQFTAKKFMQWCRQSDIVDDKKGSLALTWPINVGRSPNTTTFDGDDDLPISSLSGNLYRASLGWRQYTDALSLPITDLAQNNGSPEAIGNLLDAQLEITKMSLIDKIASDLILNTYNIDPKGVSGLAGAVDDGTVIPDYAGFGRASLGAAWKSQVNYAIPNSTSANISANLHSLDLQASQDGQRPTAYFSNITGLGQLIQSLFAQDRYMQPEMGRTAGGNDYILNGNPFYIDTAIPTGVVSPSASPPSGTNSGGFVYMLNPKYIRLVVNPAFNMSMLDWQIGQNNLTIFTRILWFANLVILKPSAQAVAWVQGF
jgi:hypothetical protein